mgnify:CR=1 FL=1
MRGTPGPRSDLPRVRDVPGTTNGLRFPVAGRLWLLDFARADS